jgi:hypothetical protein
MTKPPAKPVMRSLGEFFGEVWKGLRADPRALQQGRVARRTIEQETRDTPMGKVILRRTIVEEVIVPERRADEPG